MCLYRNKRKSKIEMNKPFEGDTFIKAELVKLRDIFGLKNCVETGTQYGSTALELLDVFKSVVTIEADKELYEQAKKRFRDLNLHGWVYSLFGKSEDGLIKMTVFDNTLYYLDAHGGNTGGCPLKKELEIIAQKNCNNICIAIHDFKVPGHPELGYDTYDFELCYEEIEPYLKMIYPNGFNYHYNSEADGAHRGIIYIYPLTSKI